MNIINFLRLLEISISVVVIPLITLIFAKKLLNEKKETRKLNNIRLLILCTFISFCWMIIWEFLYDYGLLSSILTEEIFGQESESFSIYNFGLGFLVTFGLVLVCYANQWESLYYMPIYIYVGMIIFFLFTGYSAWLLTYIYISGVIGLTFLYITGFKLKDNGSLGLAIIFTLAFITLFVNEYHLAGLILNFSYLGFMVFFVLGYFTPYKIKEVDEAD